MPRIKFPKSSYQVVSIEGKKRRVIKKSQFAKFDIKSLGLGDVSAPSTPIDAIAAVFDLEGFTNFCKQLEPHLTVPRYLHKFLEWIMEAVREEMKDSETEHGVAVWCPLPFFVKFLGDGLLMMWSCEDMNPAALMNVVAVCGNVRAHYRKKLLPTLRSEFVEPPPILRCGVARGTVFSIGNGNDYVGSCINMAARLQKLPGVEFCFNRRGFDIHAGVNTKKWIADNFEVKEVAIRGIGDHELILARKSDLQQMSPTDRKFYRDV